MKFNECVVGEFDECTIDFGKLDELGGYRSIPIVFDYNLVKLHEEKGYELILDETQWTVRLGEWCNTIGDETFRSTLDLVCKIYRDNNIPVFFEKDFTHDIYRQFAKIFKITPKGMRTRIEKVKYKWLIDGINPTVLHNCFYDSPYSRSISRIGKDFKNVKPLLVQCIEDGIQNITPIVCYYGSAPEDLKKRFGKSTWKRICKRSITANAIMIRHLRNGADINQVMNLPTTLLKYMPWYTDSVVYAHSTQISNIVRKNRKVSDIHFCKQIVELVSDTKMLCHNFSIAYKDIWSERKIRELHDELTKRTMLARYSDTPFDADTYKHLFRQFDCECGSAKLLLSPLEVGNEGVAMKHCVGGFALRCTIGIYAVYHIVDSNGEQSTLGLIYNNDLGWTHNQHYTRYNKTASPFCLEVGHLLINEIKNCGTLGIQKQNKGV